MDYIDYLTGIANTNITPDCEYAEGIIRPEFCPYAMGSWPKGSIEVRDTDNPNDWYTCWYTFEVNGNCVVELTPTRPGIVKPPTSFIVE